MRPAAVQITSGGRREGVESELDGGEPKSAVCRLTQHFFFLLLLLRCTAEERKWENGETGGRTSRGGETDRQTGRPRGGGLIERR